MFKLWENSSGMRNNQKVENQGDTSAHWEKRREKSILKSFQHNLPDPQRFVFAFLPSPAPSQWTGTHCITFLCDSSLIKQSVPLVALVINQGFFLSLGPCLAQSLQCVWSLTFPISLVNGCSHVSVTGMLPHFSMMLCNFTENINAWSVIAPFFSPLSEKKKIITRVTCSP